MSTKFFHRTFILLACFTASFSAVSQKKNIDSMSTAIKKMPDDTIKAMYLSGFIKDLFNYGEFDRAIDHNLQLKQLGHKLTSSPDKKVVTWGNNSITRYYAVLGSLAMKDHNTELATRVYDTALVFAQKSGDKVGLAFIYGNIGIIYKQQSLYPQALDQFFKALRMLEEIGNERGIVANLANIGNIYKTMGEFDKAFDFYGRSTKLAEKLGDKNDIADSYTRLGNIYEIKKEWKTAEDYYMKAIALFEETGNLVFLSTAYGNLAVMYDQHNEDEKALKYYGKALELDEKLGKKSAASVQLENLGNIYLERKEFKKAENYFEQSLSISREIKDLDGIRSLSNGLSKLYEQTGRFSEALEAYKNYINARDSIFNEENTKKMVRSEMNFEFEKKEAAAKLEQEKKEAVAMAESKKQKTIIWSVCGVLILVIAFAVFAYRSFLEKKKANIAIQKQKTIIEEKQKEILDSIYYAKRIQQALITSETYIQRSIKRLKQERA
jgi:tetratricopeptide (TPR) repeat protein